MSEDRRVYVFSQGDYSDYGISELCWGPENFDLAKAVAEYLCTTRGQTNEQLLRLYTKHTRDTKVCYCLDWERWLLEQCSYWYEGPSLFEFLQKHCGFEPLDYREIHL